MKFNKSACKKFPFDKRSIVERLSAQKIADSHHTLFVTIGACLMRIKSILLSLSAVVALSAGVANAATNLVTNGNFSDTSQGGNKQLAYTTNNIEANRTTLDGWTSSNRNDRYNFVLDTAIANTDKSVKWMKTSIAGGLGQGNVFASDSQYLPGTLSQNITGLTAGGLYTLTFDFALAQQVGFNGVNNDNFWQVGFGDVNPTQNSALLSIANGGFSGWKTATMTFAATSTSQVLSFLAQGTGPGAPPFLLLDNVSLISAVPEPSTWGMMLGGLGLVGFLARRRRAAKLA